MSHQLGEIKKNGLEEGVIQGKLKKVDAIQVLKHLDSFRSREREREMERERREREIERERHERQMERERREREEQPPKVIKNLKVLKNCFLFILRTQMSLLSFKN